MEVNDTNEQHLTVITIKTN